jgi:hypothetical protein
MRRISEHPVVRQKIDMLCGEYEASRILYPMKNTYISELLSDRYDNILEVLEGEASYCVLHCKGSLNLKKGDFVVIHADNINVSFVLKQDLKESVLFMLDQLQQEQSFLIKTLQSIN